MKRYLFFCSIFFLLSFGRLGFAQDLPVMDGLQLWLDATDASTVFQAPFFEEPASPGDFVESWMDKSPNQFEAYVDFENGAGSPIYAADGINGLPSVRFFGEFADGMIIDGLVLERPYTAFIANQYWGDVRGRTLQSQDTNWLLGLWSGNWGHYAEGWVTPQPAADVNRPYVADAVGTEDASFFVINGVEGWTTNSSPVGVPGSLAIAGAGAYPGEVSDADISEIIIYDRVLSDDELSSMRSHLYAKYGTTPVDEPPPPAELIVHKGIVDTFSGAADLDFSGDFAYAVNVGGPSEDLFGDPLTIDDAVFLDGTNAAEPDLNDEGIAMTVVNEIIDWHDPEYGDTEADDNLELVMQSIRWNVPPGVAIDLDVEEGASYKLQLLFAESCCDRGFDIFMDDEEVVTDLVVQKEQGGINNQQTGVSYTREFVASDDQLNVLLGGSVAVPDNNPILNGFTLERIEDIVSLVGDCNSDGILDVLDLSCVSTIEERDAVLDANGWIEGDLNGENGVDFADFLILSGNFGDDTKTAYSEGDIGLEGDGPQFSDFLAMSANFGQGNVAAAVPEPASARLIVVAFALFGLVRCRRRS